MPISKETRESIKDWVTIVAVVAGGLWAVWTFTFEQIFKAAFEKPYIHAVVSMDPGLPQPYVSSIEDAVPIALRVEVENMSKRRLRVLAASLTMFGDKLKSFPGGQLSLQSQAELVNSDKDYSGKSHYWSRTEHSPLFTGSALVGWILEPGEKSGFTRLAWVPRNKYQQLEARLRLDMTTAPESDACMVQKGNDPEKGLLPYRGHMTTPGLIETCELLPENDPTNKRFFQNIVSNETSSFLALPAPAVSGAK